MLARSAETHQLGGNRDRGSTGTLGKALSVLDIVASADEPLRFTDILARCDQPRGTLHRQLTNLVDEGLLTLNRDHVYALGPRLLTLAASAWSKNTFRTIAEPHIDALHEATGETVHLAVLNGIEVVYLDKVESRQTVRMHSQVGNASPAYCTGVGKAMLAALPADEFERRLAQMSFHRHTDNTITTARDMRAEIERIRREGIAHDREEHEPGIRCVAAAVADHAQKFYAGVSVTAPSFRLEAQDLEKWARLVRKAAAAIAADMAIHLGPRNRE